jgi:hypothetical protein
MKSFGLCTLWIYVKLMWIYSCLVFLIMDKNINCVLILICVVAVMRVNVKYATPIFQSWYCATFLCLYEELKSMSKNFIKGVPLIPFNKPLGTLIYLIVYI